MTCPRPDGSWLPTVPVPVAPFRVIGPDGTEWTLTPVTEGGYIASSPTFSVEPRVPVVIVATEGTAGELVVIEATPGCGPAPSAAAPVPPATSPPPASDGPAPTSTPAVVVATVGEPSATTLAAVEDAGRERSGLGGLVFLLACVVLAIVFMIGRSVLREEHRPIGGGIDPHPPLPPPDVPPTSPPPAATAPPPVARPGASPTISEPAPPPTTFDPEDPAVERYAKQVASWLHRS